MKKRHFPLTIILFWLAAPTVIKGQGLSDLVQNQKLNGFSATSVYLNDAGERMGGRFMHDKTGFTLDLLRIESVPQTYVWVNSPPLSDKGEPHTQEHLLITKGNKGHALNTRESMSLASSNAFTSQIYTAYHFHTVAGADVFYGLMEQYLDALLHPDYTDEEVHREVCNWGVAEDAETKKLRLEEKGTVYNEMKTSMNNPYAASYYSLGRMLYGTNHPMSYNAGGMPDDIRVLDAEMIRKFHDLNYHLDNMGAITALPKNLSLADVLKAMDAMLNRLQAGEPSKRTTKSELPPPHPAASGIIETTSYPSTNSNDPGHMLLAWPASLKLDPTEKLLLNSFLTVFAGEPGTNLYKKFIDSKTKEMDLGAQGLFAYVDNGQGQPVIIGITDMDAGNLTNANAARVKKAILEELRNIADYKEGSAELKEFNDRFKNNLADMKRSLANSRIRLPDSVTVIHMKDGTSR
jgi:Zn-dependent M16 (insulinase) family peptidase